MSYVAGLDTGHGVQVASNNGWAAFAAWVESLKGPYPQLRHLVEHGWNDDFCLTIHDLAMALAQEPPEDASIASVGAEFMALERAHRDAKAIVISHGFGEAE